MMRPVGWVGWAWCHLLRPLVSRPTLSGYPNKPLRLRLTGSLTIRGPVGKDPFEALASPRMVGGHHAE